MSGNQFNLSLGDELALFFIIYDPEVQVGEVHLLGVALLIKILQHVSREAVLDPIFLGQYERRLDGPRFEEVRMIAHFPELHKDAHDTEEVAVGEDVLCLVLIDVLVIQ